MQKELLTKEDKITLKKQRSFFSFPILIMILVRLGVWCCYIYYFRESHFEINGRAYIIDLVMLVLIGILLTGMYITSKIEFFLGYKWVFVGYIKTKNSIDNDGATYQFFINERKITVSKEDYEKYEKGQKIKVELTSIFKQTLRVIAIN